MNNCFTLIKKGDVDGAKTAYESLNEEEKTFFFKQLRTYICPPQHISVLKRHLKTGFNYDDYRKAWLPPQESINPDEDSMHYFSFPVRVMNFIDHENSRDILSIGFLWTTREEIEKEIIQKQESESSRHHSIQQVADIIGKTEFYALKDSQNLGV